MGWHGVANATPEYQGASFLPPLGKCLFNLFCCFFFITKEISPEILIELHPDLCDILEHSVFLVTHYPFDFDNIEYKIGSQILPPLKHKPGYRLEYLAVLNINFLYFSFTDISKFLYAP